MSQRQLPPFPTTSLEALATSLYLRFAELYAVSELFFRGTGTPEGNVVAVVGAVFQQTDGGSGTTLYVKESGTGNTGWVAK